MKKLTKQQMEVVKREHPEWFNEVEVGKWYFKQYNGKSSIIFFCQGHRNGCAYGYGIDTSSNGETEWFSDDEVVESNNDGFREATHEEVKQALIAEAKRRYQDVKNIGDDLLPDWGRIAEYGFSEFHYQETENRLYSAPNGGGGLVVFDSGQWASVIPQEKLTLQADIQALKDRWPDINFTVIAGGKEMSKLIITSMSVMPRRRGGEQQFGITTPKEITVSVSAEFVSTGDLEKYWDNTDELAKIVFMRLFGEYIKNDKLEIEL